jgi:transglutaminase-like putative cysteine protease
MSPSPSTPAVREIVSDPVRVYLAPAEYIDSDHPAIRAEASRLAPPGASDAERARALFYAVREIRYGYVDHNDLETCRASSVLAAQYGYCVGKASLLCALCRAAGIPARIGFADVSNHHATPRLLETMGSNVFAWHGYSELLIGGRWLRVSPTFNASLCAKFGVAPLEFDGASDALLQAYDHAGTAFMQYLRYHGHFHDVPARFMREEMARLYPRLAEPGGLDGDMEAEAAADAGA